jgi:hypothetical protein
MQLSRHGARHVPAALSSENLDQIEQVLSGTPADRPGIRLTGLPALSVLLSPEGCIGRHPAATLGAAARPVRALLFNKSKDQNWSLGWHQDRTIAVADRIDTSGFSNWTIKSGIQHVEPPFDLLERMLTVRVHLDDVGPANAPLLIVPGSHRLGRIPEAQLAATAARLGSHACLAFRGDIWIYATPIVHASDASAENASRRVLQVDYSNAELPAGLEWLGI